MKIARLSTFLTCMLISMSGCRDTSRATVYFVPFQAETYVPVTPENIKERAQRTIKIDDETTLAKVLGLIPVTGGSALFDKKRVRLLIVLSPGARRVLVDAGGNVIAGDAQGVLTIQQFEKLEKLLSDLVDTKGK